MDPRYAQYSGPAHPDQPHANPQFYPHPLPPGAIPQGAPMFFPGAHPLGMGGHSMPPQFLDNQGMNQAFPRPGSLGFTVSMLQNPNDDGANKNSTVPPSHTEEGQHLMSVCLCNNQLLARYPKLVLTKHSAAMTNQPTSISFCPFIIKLKYNFPNISPVDRLKLSLEVKMGNKELMVKCHNREIDVKRQMGAIVLTVKEHSIALPHADSWKKLNPRADGIKQNVQGFVRKLRMLEVSFIDGPHHYVFSTQVICCAATSFQNALKTYRDNEQSQAELLEFINQIPAPRLAIRSAQAIFEKFQNQPPPADANQPTLKRQRPNGTSGPLWEWWNNAPTVHNIEQFFAPAPWWSPLFQKNWEGCIKFFHDHIGEPTIPKIINEITTLFTPEWFISNVRHTCESQYFGGLIDPRRVVAQMKIDFLEDVTLYPDGCVIFVIWKRPTEKNFYYYLIESPYWDVVERRFIQTSPGDHKDQRFPCAIRKLQICGEQKLGLVTRHQQGIRNNQAINMSYITEAWGKAPLAVFQIREDTWGQNSSEHLANCFLRDEHVVLGERMRLETGGLLTLDTSLNLAEEAQLQPQHTYSPSLGSSMKLDEALGGQFSYGLGLEDPYLSPSLGFGDIDHEYPDTDLEMSSPGGDDDIPVHELFLRTGTKN